MMMQTQLPLSSATKTASHAVMPAWPAMMPEVRRQVPPSHTCGKVTEVIIQDGDDYDYELLLPLFERVSRDHRWLAWIAPPRQAHRNALQMAGIDTRKIITLTPNERHSTYQLACQALKTGTSHVVIRWQGPLSDMAFAGLQAAARQGHSQAILIRTR